MRTWRRARAVPSWVPAVGTAPGWHPRYELIGCALRGHHIAPSAGRAPDPALSRSMGGLWWDRCLRCDAWLPRPDAPPRRPGEAPGRGGRRVPSSAAGAAQQVLPGQRTGVRPPIRGRLLRDKYVLRAIAVDRGVHVVVLAALGIAVTLFAAHRTQLRALLTRVVDAAEGSQSTTLSTSGHGLLHTLSQVASWGPTSLHLATAAVWGYALLELVEAVGLWFARRWAEYLTLVVTSALLPVEVFEVTEQVTWLRVSALAVNLAIVVYLLLAKRLFGLRGGAAAERAERLADSGWLPVERATPPLAGPGGGEDGDHDGPGSAPDRLPEGAARG